MVVLVPVLSAAAASAPEQSPVAATAGGAPGPMARGFATKAEADAATAEVMKAVEGKMPRAAATGQCSGSWIFLNASLGYFDHADPNPAYIMGYVSAGYAPCRNLTLGGRYNACGYSNANGWILMPDVFGFHGYPWAGFVSSTCTSDP
ncbi:hypothetical protein ACSHWB_40415 [Lentzea sp. HUAS TT2]|uniref:hypothetical protein n=1 Tax=Lentzea sp. HUAS TT2 TaxID=3447454 RepID=UPI003F6ED801